MPALNQAGRSPDWFLSYGTATADGALALRAAGVPDSDDRMARGIAWLDRHQRTDRVPGFNPGVNDVESPHASWSTELRFYYAAAIARAGS